MKFLLLFFYLLSSFFAFSQNFICDIDSKQPIESAHISYELDKGLITNKDGFFSLNFSKGIDTLHITHLSYKTKNVLFKTLKKNDTIFLKKATIELKDVVISSVNPKKIVIKGIQRIDNNYLNTSYNQFGFLRQSIEENGKGINMIEVSFTNYYNKKQKLYSNITNARRTKNYASIDIDITGGVLSKV